MQDALLRRLHLLPDNIVVGSFADVSEIFTSVCGTKGLAENLLFVFTVLCLGSLCSQLKQSGYRDITCFVPQTSQS
jgi:hypothetical protein